MALVINDRVKETTTTTGTGTVSLGGAVTGFETFAAGIGNSNTVYYCIAHQDQAEFEVGLGTLDGDSSDLARTTIISSSNSDSAVNFSSGTKDVFCTLPASKLIFEDGSNNVAFGGAVTGVTNLTASGELDAATLDISGNADIDGTLEADAITVNGTTLAEVISDTTGAMFSSNTETGITVTYQDADNTIDLALSAAQTTITSLLATDIKIGEDDQTKIDFETADEIHFYAANVEQVYLGDNIFGPQSDSDVDLGSTGVRWKDAFVDSLTVTGDISVGDDLTVNGGVLDVKNAGAQSVVRFYCESSNAHYAQIQAPAHSAFSGNVTLTLPAATDTLVGKATTDTLTNKTLTSPKINEDVAVTSTATEINLIDGDTSRGTTAVASGDGILINDAGTMRMTNVDTVSTYFAGHNVGGSNIVTTGALNSGSITSGFGTIDTGSSTITTTGLISGGSLDIDNVLINGTTIGHTDDTDLITVADGLVTVAGEVQMTTLDIGGTNVTSTAAELNYSDLATLGTTAASKVYTADANGLTKISGAALYTEDTLTDGATVAWDVIASPVAKLTMAGNRTISAPSGTTPAAGQFVSLLLIQDGTGSRTITWNAVYEFTADTAPTLTTTANKGDLFVFRYNGSKWLEVGRNLNLTLS
jgi:hypothetical protein